MNILKTNDYYGVLIVLITMANTYTGHLFLVAVIRGVDGSGELLIGEDTDVPVTFQCDCRQSFVVDHGRS